MEKENNTPLLSSIVCNTTTADLVDSDNVIKLLKDLGKARIKDFKVHDKVYEGGGDVLLFKSILGYTYVLIFKAKATDDIYVDYTCCAYTENYLSSLRDKLIPNSRYFNAGVGNLQLDYIDMVKQIECVNSYVKDDRQLTDDESIILSKESSLHILAMYVSLGILTTDEFVSYANSELSLVKINEDQKALLRAYLNAGDEDIKNFTLSEIV